MQYWWHNTNTTSVGASHTPQGQTKTDDTNNEIEIMANEKEEVDTNFGEASSFNYELIIWILAS